MKDYSRKNRFAKRYSDLMRTTPQKAIFNSVIESFPVYSEFNSRGGSTPQSRAYDQYMRQSELKKTNQGKRFPEMEDDWSGQPGLPPGKFDQEWNLQIPWNPTSGDVGDFVLFAFTDDEYCIGSTREIAINATHPIYGLEFTFPGLEEPGTSFTVLSGLGTPNVVISLTVDAAETGGPISLRAYLQAFNAPGGSSQAGRGWVGFAVSQARDEDCPIKKYILFTFVTKKAANPDGASYAVIYDIGLGQVATDVPDGIGGFLTFPTLTSNLNPWLTDPGNPPTSLGVSLWGTIGSQTICGPTGAIDAFLVRQRTDYAVQVCNGGTVAPNEVVITNTNYNCNPAETALGRDALEYESYFRSVAGVTCPTGGGTQDFVEFWEKMDLVSIPFTTVSYGTKYIGLSYHYQWDDVATKTANTCVTGGLPPPCVIGTESEVDDGDGYWQFFDIVSTQGSAKSILNNFPDNKRITTWNTTTPTDNLDMDQLYSGGNSSWGPSGATLFNMFYAPLQCTTWPDSNISKHYSLFSLNPRTVYNGVTDKITGDPTNRPPTAGTETVVYSTYFTSRVSDLDFDPDTTVRDTGFELASEQAMALSEATQSYVPNDLQVGVANYSWDPGA